MQTHSQTNVRTRSASSSMRRKDSAAEAQEAAPHPSRATHSAAGPTIPAALRGHANRTGEGFVFQKAKHGARLLSFAELSRRVDARAMQLVACGLRKGARIGLVLSDDEDFLVTFLGALAVGIVPVPMYPPLSFGKLDGYVQTAATILKAAGATALVTDKNVQSVLWSLVDRVPCLDEIHCTDKLPPAAPGATPDVSAVELDDVAFLQFTSGSTADPKGVVVTHRTLLANMHAIMHHGLQIQSDDVAVTWLPLYHDMGLIGMMLAPIWYGVPTVHLPTLSFVKHPTAWMEAVSKHRGTITFAPNFAYAVAARRTLPATLEQLDLSSLRVLGCGAEPNHPQTLQNFLDHFAPAGLHPTAIFPCYGMAEATLAMTFARLDEALRTDYVDAEVYHNEGRAVFVPEHGREGKQILQYVSCGYPMANHTVKIVDEHGNALPDRMVGEVVFQGPSVTKGYFQQPKATLEVYRDYGLCTGDVGYMDQGELFVTGRKKDIVILNGRNYDPQTIEWAVARVENVRKGNVVAFSVPGANTEELVVVAETPLSASDTAAHSALKEDIKARVRQELFLNVHDVVLLAPGQMPKTSSGKLQRRRTKQLYTQQELTKQGVRSLGSKGDAFVLASHLWRSAWARSRHHLQRRLRRTAKRLNRLPLLSPIKRHVKARLFR